MAHATDYQSRLEKPLTRSEVATRLIRGFLKSTEWCEAESKKFCLDVYKHHGATESIFNKIWKEQKNVR